MFPPFLKRFNLYPLIRHVQKNAILRRYDLFAKAKLCRDFNITFDHTKIHCLAHPPRSCKNLHILAILHNFFDKLGLINIQMPKSTNVSLKITYITRLLVLCSQHLFLELDALDTADEKFRIQFKIDLFSRFKFHFIFYYRLIRYLFLFFFFLFLLYFRVFVFVFMFFILFMFLRLLVLFFKLF
jgi:hypothetical protein